MLKSVKLVTFDVTRTLLHFKIPPGKLYAEFAASHGVSVDADVVVKKFGVNYKQMSQSHPNFGKTSIGWEKWWETVIIKSLEDYVRNPSKACEISKDLIDSYKTGDNWVLNEGCEEILSLLKSTGITIGVISNFDPRLEGVLKDKNLDKYFDFILTSYAANCMKPDPKIFDQALILSKINNIVEQEAVHIGDDVENDYIGPKSSGWQALLVSEKEMGNTKIDKNHIFKSLKDLQSFFMSHTKCTFIHSMKEP